MLALSAFGSVPRRSVELSDRRNRAKPGARPAPIGQHATHSAVRASAALVNLAGEFEFNRCFVALREIVIASEPSTFVDFL